MFRPLTGTWSTLRENTPRLPRGTNILRMTTKMLMITDCVEARGAVERCTSDISRDGDIGAGRGQGARRALNVSICLL
eukprot:4540593-Pyramimonas_sp.AAC.1